MKKNLTTALASLLSMCALGMGSSAQAQPFDPRQPLAILISAFQNCGPPPAYQMLSPQLFNLVAQQTGGRGCYPDIAAAGPITGMEVMGSQAFPIGPMFLIRVRHSTGRTADWFIGFNQMTQRVEFLTYQAAQTTNPPPTINTGPSPTIGKGPSTDDPTPAPPPDDNGDGCQLYPAMCG